MAKKFHTKDLRNAYLANVLNTTKDKGMNALFLGIVAAGTTILLGALKNDEAADDAEIFRE